MQAGYDGLLRDKTRPSRIPPLGSDIAERVVALTRTDPPAEATHWTATMMAKAVGISASPSSASGARMIFIDREDDGRGDGRMKRNPYLHIRRIIVDQAAAQAKCDTRVSFAEHQGRARASRADREAARANERRAARKRVADAPSEPNGSPGAAPRLSGTKAEWAHAQRNVDSGSAPCRLTVEEVQKQNEAASAWAERSSAPGQRRRHLLDPHPSAPARGGDEMTYRQCIDAQPMGPNPASQSMVGDDSGTNDARRCRPVIPCGHVRYARGRLHLGHWRRSQARRYQAWSRRI